MRSGQTTDLFEMLRRRRRAAQSGATETEQPARRAPRAEAGKGGAFEALQAEAGKLWAGLRSMVASRRGGTPPPAPEPGQTGVRAGAGLDLGVGRVVVGGVLAVGLVVGFTLGRVLPSGGGEPLDMRDRGPRASISSQEPGPAAAGVRLPPEKEYEVVSDWAYLLLNYPAEQRDRASRLAAWLRGKGFPGTRLVYAKSFEQNLVVTYVEADDQTTWAALRALPAPDFEPRWSEVRGRHLAASSTSKPQDMRALLQRQQ